MVSERLEKEQITQKEGEISKKRNSDEGNGKG